MPRLGQPGRQGTPPPQGLSLPRPWPWSSEPTDRLGCSEGKREGPSSPTDTEVQRPWAWLGLGPPMRFATASASSRSKALRFAGFPARRLPALLLSLTCDCLCLAGSFLIRTCLGIIRALGFISAQPLPQPTALGLVWLGDPFSASSPHPPALHRPLQSVSSEFWVFSVSFIAAPPLGWVPLPPLLTLAALVVPALPQTLAGLPLLPPYCLC